MGTLELRRLTKRFEGVGVPAIDDVDSVVEHGERFVIVGPSGSGKTTILRLIAGLETPTCGEIRIGGVRMNEVAPRSRGVAMVFQHPALYPHLDVLSNLTFGLRARGVPRVERDARGSEVADLLGLSAMLTRKPEGLSGGERQRVALGRAISVHPSILLLDEPFSGLDAPLRASTRAVLFELHRRFGWTMILVTHDQAEASAMGDRISVMRRGTIEQTGTPVDLYESPVNRFVAEFLGDPPACLLPCNVRDGRVRILDAEYDIDGGPDETAVWVGLRAEDVVPAGNGPCVSAVLDRIERRGYDAIAWFRAADRMIAARVDRNFRAASGTAFRPAFEMSRAFWFDAEGRRVSRQVGSA